MYDLKRQITGQKRQLDLFHKWMKGIKLEELQKALNKVCEYNLGKFSGVIFEKEQKKVFIPLPDILKPYLPGQELSINEAKAYLLSLYVFKISLCAIRYGLIEPDPVMGESVYSVLKAKMGAIISPADLISLNNSQNLSELLEVVSRRFLSIDTPYAVNLQQESKLIEITTREDLIGVFIHSMSSRWVIKFMFSQGFLGVSALSLIQVAINFQRMALLLNCLVGGFGLCVFLIATGLFASSIVCARKDLVEIDKIKSGYLKYLPQWLPRPVMQRINQRIIPQYLAAEYGEAKRRKLNQLGEEDKLMFFLFGLRKKIQVENPLLTEDELLQLLQDGLEKECSWAGLQEFLKQNIQQEVLQNIDRLIDSRVSVSKKINELRRMIRGMASHISETQIRQLIMEGVKKAQNKKQFQDLMMEKVQELGLARKDNIFDRITNIFMFMG